MDFLERWLGISPDGGNGSFEVGILVVLAIGFALAAKAFRALRQRL